MKQEKGLFDEASQKPPDGKKIRGDFSAKKEGSVLEKLKNLEEKIAEAIVKIKTIKEEKIELEHRIKELEKMLSAKDIEIGKLQSEKNAVKGQVESLLSELETMEVV